MDIPQNINMEKTGSAYKIHVQAHNIAAHGLGDLSIKYLKVIRQPGLRDLRLNLTIATNLRLDGRYLLDVSLLGFYLLKIFALPKLWEGLGVCHVLQSWAHFFIGP